MSNITIRPATRNDAADLAILDNLAGHNIPMMFWRELAQSGRTEEALALGRTRLADDNEFYNWKKARVASEGDLTVGMAISYVMPEPDDEAERIVKDFEAFKPVFELYEIAAGDWFIDALAIYPSDQDKGIGKLLFDDSIANGKALGAKTMSLVLEDTNEVAYALYRAYGFEVVGQREFIPFKGALEINEWLLMSRSLT